MKKSIMKKLFAAMLMTMTCSMAWAVKPEAGKVYRIVNKAQNIAASDNGPGASVTCNASSESNSQLWIAEAGSANNTYYFRSLGTGNYLRGSSSTSSPWTTSMKNAGRTQLDLGGTDGSWTLKPTGAGSNLSMHCDGQHIVVSWSVGSNSNSMWQFELVNKTQAEIDAALAESNKMTQHVDNAETYQAALNAIFADKACTVLKDSYKNMSQANLEKDANVAKLPAELKAMVLKVQSGKWDETDPKNPAIKWDSIHASKFRVQLYEPFSEGAAAAHIVGIQNYTNMNNPTGILSDGGTVLYVMVEGEIKDGATVYMNGVTGLGMYNDTHAGIELHEGLNVIPCYSDVAHQFIYYTVQTTDKDGKRDPAHVLPNYEPLKIHIEGGSINGFFNYVGDSLYKGDTNDDWLYYRDRARHDMFDLVGKYVILHFFFPDTPYNPAGGNTTPEPGLKTLFGPAGSSPEVAEGWDFVETMKVWDRMCLSERNVMGCQSDEQLMTDPDVIVEGINPYEPREGDDVAPNDIYKYFNNRMMGITMQGNLFMNATTWRTAYNGGTVKDIINNIRTNSGAIWGPAHEYGHMNQTPMKIAGTTEISNNHFSNVAVFYQGISTSRSNYPSDMLNTFNQGLTFLENGTWGTTRMYFQLWLYYHYAGFNKKFYPRLYKLLKDNPIQKSYYLNPRYDALHFVKMCCEAAQEDLTPFFEAWGFFVPLENYHIGDYSNFIVNLTPEDIQAVKDEIKALAAEKGWKKNYQIINIDDRPGSKRVSWADYMAKENAGELGGLQDFLNRVQPSGELSFTINGFNVEIDHSKGTGGTGFVILGENDELLGFSNDYSFPISSKAAAALIDGTAKIVALSAEGNRQEVANTFLSSDAATRLAELQKLIKTVSPSLNKVDDTETKVGYFMPFYAKDLAASIESAKTLNAESSADDISKAYTDLITKYNTLLNHDHATVRFMPGSTYAIINNNYTSRALFFSSKYPDKVSNGSAKTALNHPEEYGWVFETVNISESTYRIKNAGSGKYLGKYNEENKNAPIALVAKNKAGIYTLKETEQGVFVMFENLDEGRGIQIGQEKSNGPIMFWGTGDKNSKWSLTLIEASPRGQALANLKQLVACAKELLPQGGSVETKGDAIELKGDMLTTNAKYEGENDADRFTSFDVLFDGNVNTYFHSDYSSSAPTTNHYILIDLGEGNQTSSFQLTWTTRTPEGNAATNAPTTVRVYGTNDPKQKGTLLATLSDLPTSAGASYLSPIIASPDGTGYRYVRYEVTATSTGNKFFVLSELTMNHAQLKATPVKGQPKVTEQMLIDLYTTLADGEAALESNNGNPTQAKCERAYAPLLEAYNALAEALGVETTIDEIVVDGVDFGSNGAAKGIFDLQGRRLNKVGSNGVYIVNGKKVARN